MRKTLLALIVLLPVATTAHADGFVCYAQDLVAKVYESGGSSAVMVLSDPRQPEGHRLIARFGQVEGFIDDDAATFLAQPAQEPNPSLHEGGGGSVAGIPLPEVAEFRLVVDFAWGRPRVSGEYVPGRIQLVSREGSSKNLLVDCYFHSVH